MIAVLASFLIATNAPAAELVQSCRTMIPADVELDGRIILRNRKGFSQAEYDYVLTRKAGETNLVLKDAAGNPVSFEREGRILGTDVTWSDITLDYLWWDDFSFDEERESRSGNNFDNKTSEPNFPLNKQQGSKEFIFRNYLDIDLFYLNKYNNYMQKIK